MKAKFKIGLKVIFAIIVALLVMTQCRKPDINDRRNQCIDSCSKRGLFGRLEPASPPSARYSAMAYECKCY